MNQLTYEAHNALEDLVWWASIIYTHGQEKNPRNLAVWKAKNEELVDAMGEALVKARLVVDDCVVGSEGLT